MICIFRSRALQTPLFFLARRMWLGNRMAGYASLGLSEIDFPEDREFSRAFGLYGKPEDEGALRELFDSRLRKWFVVRAELQIDFQGNGRVVTFFFNLGDRARLGPQYARGSAKLAVELHGLLASPGVCRPV